MITKASSILSDESDHRRKIQIRVRYDFLYNAKHYQSLRCKNICLIKKYQSGRKKNIIIHYFLL